MMKYVLISLALMHTLLAFAQDEFSLPSKDTIPVQNLQEVVVRGYEHHLKLMEVPAAINLVSSAQLERFNNTSILPAINTTPGVRMEERSPGSYRLNIRGSSLRSPFGVRNVKVYWDDIPFTDPGGNTYLNALGFHNIHSIEIIKGPAGSLYGSGTGGALLLQSQPARWQQGFEAEYIYGSFNMHNINAQVRVGEEDRRNTIQYSRQSSNNFRHQSNMHRDVASWQTTLKVGDKQHLSAAILFSDLYYQTPGALTQEEYNRNRRSARPATGMFPSAENSKASISQQTFLAGITNRYLLRPSFQNTTTLYGAYAGIKNPTFRNYERRMEPHFGGRSVFKWNNTAGRTDIHIVWGGEAQKGSFNTKTFGNRNGNPDTLQTDDAISNWTYTLFAQTDLRMPGDWNITAGLSLNKSSIAIRRLSVPASLPQKRTFGNEWMPRMAISKKIIEPLMLFASVSRGFSPPTVQEVLPSTSVINTDLNAEHGINYEAGIKSSWLQQKLYIEVNAYYFRLQNTIVQRRDISGGDYFINAGQTRQRGLESQLSYQLPVFPASFISGARLRASHTWNHYTYSNFVQLTNDLSGKRLPSTAPHTLSASFDLDTPFGVYANLTWFFSDPIALNDANTVYASGYHLLGGRLGWRLKAFDKLRMEVFTGVDNALNERYSLGNDINAAGGRYFNAAPGINYFAGISLQ